MLPHASSTLPNSDSESSSPCQLKSIPRVLKRVLLLASSFTIGPLQQLPLAMALSPTKYTIGSATEHSEAITDASGLATEHSEEGRPPRIPIIEVAFGNGMWW